jgi:hypothetical protein
MDSRAGWWEALENLSGRPRRAGEAPAAWAPGAPAPSQGLYLARNVRWMGVAANLSGVRPLSARSRSPRIITPCRQPEAVGDDDLSPARLVAPPPDDRLARRRYDLTIWPSFSRGPRRPRVDGQVLAPCPRSRKGRHQCVAFMLMWRTPGGEGDTRAEASARASRLGSISAIHRVHLGYVDMEPAVLGGRSWRSCRPRPQAHDPALVVSVWLEDLFASVAPA